MHEQLTNSYTGEYNIVFSPTSTGVLYIGPIFGDDSRKDVFQSLGINNLQNIGNRYPFYINIHCDIISLYINYETTIKNLSWDLNLYIHWSEFEDNYTLYLKNYSPSGLSDTIKFIYDDSLKTEYQQWVGQEIGYPGSLSTKLSVDNYEFYDTYKLNFPSFIPLTVMPA